MARHTFKRQERIHGRKEFEKTLSEGKRFRGSKITLIINKRAGYPDRRLGIIVSRKVKGSVKRNRAKRLVREFFRLNKESFPPLTDMIVIIYSYLSTYSEVEREFKAILYRLK